MTEVMQQIVLDTTPEGTPTPEHFRLVSRPLPEPAPGELLCETLYLSLDPYMRSQIAGRHLSGAIQPGDTMRGETVSRVVAGGTDAIPNGSLIRCFGGWSSHSTHEPQAVFPLSDTFPQPSLALSTLGMPGLTAWAGIHCLAKAAAGETVVIPAATGGVGAVAGQLAKARGCRVIGIAGSETKCRVAEDQLGYDQCVNRKDRDFPDALRERCPDGIDVYFDLVGGPLLTTASEQLAVGGRVILCGLMADYNSTERPAGPPPGLWIRARARIFGLVVYDFEHQRDDFLEEALPLFDAGRLRAYEEMHQGLAAAPAAFCRLMNGENQGKVVVNVGDH